MDSAEYKRDNIENEIEKRRTALKEAWDKELVTIQESAAAAAKRGYLDKHAKAHEAALRDVETLLIDEIDMECSNEILELNEKRRNEAQHLLDVAVTQTLLVIGQSYEQLLDEEKSRREQILADIQEYVDTHRKDEVARNAVIAETQRQKDEASRVTEEFVRKIETMTSEHNVICDKLKQEIVAAQAHEDAVKNDFNTRIGNELEKYKELEEQYQKLMDKYVEIDAAKAKEFEARINTLENDKRAAEEHLAHVDVIHNKYNKISVAVWIAISVATFAIGVLIGNKIFGASNATANGHYSISLTTPSEETGELSSSEAESVEE